MTKYFQGKYRIKSVRMPGWDYRWSGAYFITICTKGRKFYLGECKNGKMTLSIAGAIVQGFWYEITAHFPHVGLGAFQVMPNHIHGIIIINGSKNFQGRDIPNNPNRSVNRFYSKISPDSGSLSTVVRSFKSVCTKYINQAIPDMHFRWQDRFYDHIIRNRNSYYNISRYIVNNPKNWQRNRFKIPDK